MVAERKLKKNSEMSKKVVETDKVVAESETKIKTESVVEETTSLDVQEQTNVTTTEGGVSKKEKEKEDDYMSNPVSVYISKLNNYVERITTMNKELKELVNVGKSLEKDFNNIVKVMSKKSKNKSSEKRHPSGFAVPYKLSNELYTFLNINNGDKVPRNDVTRMINEYITSNSLRDENDRRIIKPNTELHKIFNSTNKDSITYFNLQSYIKHHFIKEKV
jgi:chromatin remodeling complex protein RSC6